MRNCWILVRQLKPKVEEFPVNSSNCFQRLGTRLVAFSQEKKTREREVPIAENLMETVKEYIPDDLKKFVLLCEGKTCTWIHSEIMDDNVYMEPSTDSTSDSSCTDGRVGEGVIPIHLDVFRGDVSFLKQLLSSYKLPFFKKEPEQKQATDSQFQRLSYHAMCYCVLHDIWVAICQFVGRRRCNCLISIVSHQEGAVALIS